MPLRGIVRMVEPKDLREAPDRIESDSVRSSIGPTRISNRSSVLVVKSSLGRMLCGARSPIRLLPTASQSE